MSIQTHLASLSQEQREDILGKDTADVRHGAFTRKSVVHAGLVGAPADIANYQTLWKDAMDSAAIKEPDKDREVAVYVHIPFCQTKCIYCGFYQNAKNQTEEDRYVDALIEEMRREASLGKVRESKVSAVFFGGGTPSSLSPKNAERLLSCVHDTFHLTDDVEFTMEGRIHDVTEDKLTVWKEGGVNRVSLGVQSFSTELRRKLGRIETREEVLKRLETMQAYDFVTIVDLIYGLPGQTVDAWLEEVETASRAPIDGMDLYQLTSFSGSDLEKAIKRGTIAPVADIAGQADLYHAARKVLLEKGYERLSLVHWRLGVRERSRYNTMAKTGAIILPYGCGAGGNVGGLSFMQNRKLDDYLKKVERGEKPIMMMGHQVDEPLRSAHDIIIRDLEQGVVDMGELSSLDGRLMELTMILSAWRRKGLIEKGQGARWKLTPDGEFWYVTMTQILVEMMQIALTGGQSSMVDHMRRLAVKGEIPKEMMQELGSMPDEVKRRMLAKIKDMPEMQAVYKELSATLS